MYENWIRHTFTRSLLEADGDDKSPASDPEAAKKLYDKYYTEGEEEYKDDTDVDEQDDDDMHKSADAYAMECMKEELGDEEGQKAYDLATSSSKNESDDEDDKEDDEDDEKPKKKDDEDKEALKEKRRSRK